MVVVGATSRYFAVLAVLAILWGCGAPPLGPGEAALAQGRYPEGVERLRAGLGHGANAADELRMKTLLAYGLSKVGDREAAEAVFEEVGEIIGASAEGEAKGRYLLYRGLYESDREAWAEATESLEAARDLMIGEGLSKTVEFGMCLSGLGFARAVGGDDGGAERDLARALNVLRRHRKAYPLAYAECESNMATLLLSSGRVQAATPHYEKALESLRRADLGQSELMAHTLNGVAYTQYQSGKYAEAEESLNEAIAVFSKLSGAVSEDVAKCYHDLGKVHEFSGRLEAAETAFRKSAQVYGDALGGEHPYTVRVLEGLRDFLTEQGRAGDAALVTAELVAAESIGSELEE